jgi:prevent-host-death family protein
MVYSMRYARTMAKTVPVKSTRNGRPAAAVIRIDAYEALEETAEILSDANTLTAIEAGLAELSRGESVTLEDLRRELAERRAAG